MQPSRDYRQSESYITPPDASEAAGRAESPLQTGSSEASNPAARDPGRLLLEVIEETLRGEDAGLSEQEWESLRGVARSRPDQPLDLATLSVLVTTLLADRFETFAGDPVSLQRMSMRISGSLWAHPISQARLHRFWEQLLGHPT